MTDKSILIVEDEPPLAELLRYNIETGGFKTLMTTCGEEALLTAAEEKPDLIILDWMLPDISGIEVCRNLRSRHESKSVPIIMLTAKGEDSDKVSGLGAGADDYIVKPFSPAELLARINAVLRRSDSSLGRERFEYADIVVDCFSHKVTRDGKIILTNLGRNLQKDIGLDSGVYRRIIVSRDIVESNLDKMLTSLD